MYILGVGFFLLLSTSSGSYQDPLCDATRRTCHGRGPVDATAVAASSSAKSDWRKRKRPTSGDKGRQTYRHMSCSVRDSIKCHEGF